MATNPTGSQQHGAADIPAVDHQVGTSGPLDSCLALPYP
jgi:hypothetical protein